MQITFSPPSPDQHLSQWLRAARRQCMDTLHLLPFQHMDDRTMAQLGGLIFPGCGEFTRQAAEGLLRHRALFPDVGDPAALSHEIEERQVRADQWESLEILFTELARQANRSRIYEQGVSVALAKGLMERVIHGANHPEYLPDLQHESRVSAILCAIAIFGAMQEKQRAAAAAARPPKKEKPPKDPRRVAAAAKERAERLRAFGDYLVRTVLGPREPAAAAAPAAAVEPAPVVVEPAPVEPAAVAAVVAAKGGRTEDLRAFAQLSPSTARLFLGEGLRVPMLDYRPQPLGERSAHERAQQAQRRARRHRQQGARRAAGEGGSG